jgi:transposase InsO family protein
VRDAVIAFVRHWSSRVELPMARLLRWLGIPKCTFCRWSKRLGVSANHNAHAPKDGWLASWEKHAIIQFHAQHPLDGYRRLAYMMLDRDLVAVSPSSVYRVLKAAGLIRPWNGKPSKKGTGFQQPENAHEHWHIDVSYLNIAGTFYYLCGVLDGYSRAVVHWEIRERMTERDVETIIQRAREGCPGVFPRIISDNGPQFIARDFKQFIRICGMDHVRTSPYYPQSNGKIERWHGTLKVECIRPKMPLSLQDARRLVTEFVTHYNTERLHSAIGYIAPRDKLEGRGETIWTERRRKLAEARFRRAQAASPDTKRGLPQEASMA